MSERRYRRWGRVLMGRVVVRLIVTVGVVARCKKEERSELTNEGNSGSRKESKTHRGRIDCSTRWDIVLELVFTCGTEEVEVLLL